ncbi:MAG: YdcF family protein [Bryobacteraceae bacterium]
MNSAQPQPAIDRLGKSSLGQTHPQIASAFGGVFTRRPRWGLSWLGHLLLVIVLFGIAALVFLRAYPFLAVTDRQQTDILVVEGWLRIYGIKQAVAEFTQRGYKRAFTTGGPITGMGGYTNDYNTSASVGAGQLRAAGLSSELVVMVPSRVSARDRTYASAIALRDWFAENGLHPLRINVATEGPHARRTQLLFQRAFGSEVRVGVVPIQNPDYDPKRWWRYSEGVRDVLGEGLAYIYAKLFFHPDEEVSRA